MQQEPLDNLLAEIDTALDTHDQTATELNREDYAASLLILDKNKTIVPYVPNRAQQHFIAHRTGRDLILKARQLGFSTAIQAEHFLDAITSTVGCATLAHDDETTQKLRRMAKRFYDSIPEKDRPPRGLDNATTTTYPNTSAEVTISTAGSVNTGRGGTYNRVHGSEVAFWKDAEALMAGILQGVPESGQIVLESTPNGAQGWFYDKCMEALDDNSDWTLHFYAWWWDDAYQIPLGGGETLPFIDDATELEEQTLIAAHGLTPAQIKWRRKKKRELGRLFPQEYPEDPRTCFLTSGDGYFADIHDLDRVFAAKLGALPITGHIYIAALDFGQKQDFSALSIIDATTLEEVELWTLNRVAWEDIRKRVRESCVKWGVRVLYPETNSMGSSQIELLVKEFAQNSVKTLIDGFDMTPESKPSIVMNFHWGIDEGGLKLLPDSIGRAEINNFKAKQTPRGYWSYEGLPHDDTVVARMIAWHGVSNGQSSISMTAKRWA